jgi:hypothetical protein
MPTSPPAPSEPAAPPAPVGPTSSPPLSRRHLLGLVATAGISVVGASLVRSHRLGAMPFAEHPLGATSPDAAPDAPATTTLDLGTVAVIGDSITYISADAIRAAVTDVEQLTVDGRWGFTIAELRPDALLLALTAPDVVVVNLGTNDARNGVPTSTSRSDLDAMLALFPHASKTLVTINTHFGPPACQARAQAINDHIRALDLPIVDWDAMVADELAAGFPQGPITSDTIHPTALGQRLLARAIARRLDATATATSATTAAPGRSTG